MDCCVGHNLSQNLPITLYMTKGVPESPPLILPPEWRYVFDDPDAQAITQVAENPDITTPAESRLARRYPDYQVLTSQEVAAAHALASPPTSPRFPAGIWQSWKNVRAAVVATVTADPPPSLTAARQRWEQALDSIATADRAPATVTERIVPALETMLDCLGLLAPYAQELVQTGVIALLTDQTLPAAQRIFVVGNMIGPGRVSLDEAAWANAFRSAPADAMVGESMLARYRLLHDEADLEIMLKGLLQSLDPERARAGLAIFLSWQRTMPEEWPSSPEMDAILLAAARRLITDPTATTRVIALRTILSPQFRKARQDDHVLAKHMTDPDAEVRLTALQMGLDPTRNNTFFEFSVPESLEIEAALHDRFADTDHRIRLAAVRFHTSLMAAFAASIPIGHLPEDASVTRAKLRYYDGLAVLRRLLVESPHGEVREALVNSYPLDQARFSSHLSFAMDRQAVIALFRDRLATDPSPAVRVSALARYAALVSAPDAPSQTTPPGIPDHRSVAWSDAMKLVIRRLREDPAPEVQVKAMEVLSETSPSLLARLTPTQVENALSGLRSHLQSPHVEVQNMALRVYRQWQKKIFDHIAPGETQTEF